MQTGSMYGARSVPMEMESTSRRHIILTPFDLGQHSSGRVIISTHYCHKYTDVYHDSRCVCNQGTSSGIPRKHLKSKIVPESTREVYD
jgi:hypothetical protein